jgi:hypothetical protein
MKKKSSLLIIILAVLLLYSCDMSGNNGRRSKDFWARHTVTGAYYKVKAELLYKGEKCMIWGEAASGITIDSASTMAYYYDNIIYPRMINTFDPGITFIDDRTGTVVARNIMELADFISDGDGKLCILLLDIKDSYNKGVNDAYVAGYFSSLNLYKNEVSDLYPELRYSNECDMIYVDINPGIPGSEQINSTLAHEMQHLMNFTISAATNRRSKPYIMDLWIDEGLSSAAEWAWNQEHSQGRIEWYNGDSHEKDGRIVNGNNFFVWGNYTDEYPAAILDDYATVYLFFQWLRLQAGNTNIYKNIIWSNYTDYRAVTTAAAAINSEYSSDWGLLLRDWLAANYINAPNGRYGYEGDPALSEIEAKNLSGTAKSYPLAPGEGIYTAKTSMPAATAYVKYAGLPARGSTATPSDSSVPISGALLSYNIDTRLNGSSSPSNPFSMETAPQDIMGVNTLPETNARSLTGQRRSQPSGPYPIGIGDMLRQNGHENVSGLDFSNFRKGIETADE